MLVKMIVEIVIMWACFVLFMWILVGRGRGPVGGIQYAPEQVQKRVTECGLITQEHIRKQRICASVLLILMDIIVPFMMIYLINGGRSWWAFVWQWCVLIMGQELFDWFAVDIYWVCYTDWWNIPEARDLEYLWRDPKTMKKKCRKKYIMVYMSLPVLALIIGSLCYGISLLIR